MFSGPQFSHYIYFLFAPTLIYRDEYPRNSKIDWTFVLEMFGQVFAAIIYVYYVVLRFCVPTFTHLNQTEITLTTFVSVLFNSIMPGSLFLLLSKRNTIVRTLSTTRIFSLLRFPSLLVECLC
jgi:sterol O-acyltransferase